MLRRISTAIAAVAMIALCSIPALASPTASHSAVHKFTVPSVSSAVKAWGSYQRLGKRVKVQICARQVRPAFAVGAIAVTYNANYSRSSNIAGVVLEQGPGNTACGTMTFLFTTAHLKVHTFLGQGGRIVKVSKIKQIY